MFQSGVNALINPAHPQTSTSQAAANDPATKSAQPQPLQTVLNDLNLDDLPMGSPLSPSMVAGGHTGIFSFDSVPTNQTQQQQGEENDGENVKNITCFIVILDLLLKQVSF